MIQSQNIELKELNQPLTDTLQKPQSLENTDKGGSDEKPTEQILVRSDDNVNRPSTRGAFRPVRNGNIRGSIIAILTSAIGTGCLNLPFRVHQLGVISFMVVICLAGALSFFGMYFMELIISKCRVQSYAQMINKAFGEKKRRYAEFILIFYTWATSICFEVIFIKFAVQLLYDVLGWPLYYNRDTQEYSNLGNTVKVIMGILLVVLNGKNFMITDLNQILQSAGRKSVIGLSICILLVILTAFFGFTRSFDGQQVEFQSIFRMNYQLVQSYKVLSWDSISAFLQATSGIYFFFLNHQFVFPLINHLKRPTKKRVERIFIWSHFQLVGVYMFYGIMGYLLLAQHRDIIPISSLIITSIPTLPLTIGKIMVTVSIFFRIPLQLFTTKQFLYEAMDLQRNERNLIKMNLILSISSIVIAILFQSVNMYFALIGGTLGLAIACLMPLACVLKIVHINQNVFWMLVFAGVMSVICFLGAMLSVISPA